MHPLQVLKKKISEDGSTVLYKIRWSNESITYEPLLDMKKECLVLVNRWEVEGGSKKSQLPTQNQETKPAFLQSAKNSYTSTLIKPIVPPPLTKQHDKILPKIPERVFAKEKTPNFQLIKTLQNQFRDQSFNQIGTFAKVSKARTQSSEEPKPQKKVKATDMFEDISSIHSLNMHRPRTSQPCIIKAIKKNASSKLFFLVQRQDSETWLPYEELKKRSPVDLCHYLLSKVKWGK